MEAAASPPLPYSREKLLILGSRERDSTYPFVRRVQMSRKAGVLRLSLVFSDRGAGVAVATLAPIESQEALRSDAWAIRVLDAAGRSCLSAWSTSPCASPAVGSPRTPLAEPGELSGDPRCIRLRAGGHCPDVRARPRGLRRLRGRCPVRGRTTCY
jgi:hypothetical protein